MIRLLGATATLVCLCTPFSGFCSDSLKGEAFWYDGKWPHEHSDLKPDPAIHFGRLDNGLRYAILPNANPPDRVSLYLNVQAG